MRRRFLKWSLGLGGVWLLGCGKKSDPSKASGPARLRLAANFGGAPLEALAPPTGRVIHTEGEVGHNRLGPWSGIWTIEDA